MTNWREIVGGIAPGLAAALGGPLAGAAVKVIADKVLGRPDATEDEVFAALATGPLTGEQIVALKSAEQSFQIEMAKVDQARDAAFIDDTKSARQQTVELAKEGSGIAWGAPVVSIMIVGGFFIAVYMLFIMERTWDERTANLLNVLFGALTVSFTSVTNYWLGSSNGSKKSGDAIRKIAEQSSGRSA